MLHFARHLSVVAYFGKKKVKFSHKLDISQNLKFYLSVLMKQLQKNPPAVQEMGSQSLGWEDPLEKEVSTHSSILAWRIPRTEESGRLQSMGLQRVTHN